MATLPIYRDPPGEEMEPLQSRSGGLWCPIPLSTDTFVVILHTCMARGDTTPLVSSQEKRKEDRDV